MSRRRTAGGASTFRMYPGWSPWALRTSRSRRAFKRRSRRTPRISKGAVKFSLRPTMRLARSRPKRLLPIDHSRSRVFPGALAGVSTHDTPWHEKTFSRCVLADSCVRVSRARCGSHMVLGRNLDVIRCESAWWSGRAWTLGIRRLGAAASSACRGGIAKACAVEACGGRRAHHRRAHSVRHADRRA